MDDELRDEFDEFEQRLVKLERLLDGMRQVYSSCNGRVVLEREG